MDVKDQRIEKQTKKKKVDYIKLLDVVKTARQRTVSRPWDLIFKNPGAHTVFCSSDGMSDEYGDI